MTAETTNSIGQQLPHRPPMLMLSAILSQDPDSVCCSSVIAAHNPLLRDGLFPVTAGVELLAQAAGILFGKRTPGKATRPGAIVQVKSFQVVPLDIPAGAELLIRARYQAGTAEAAFFEGEVHFDEQCFFSGTLMIALLPGETA